MIELVSDPIDLARLLLRSDPACGAAVSFLGTARETSRGRRVVRLEYEAYPAMARRELERIVARARERFDVEEIDVVHRVGSLRIGDAAVAIVARAPHRDAAFGACRFVIEELKKSVPIWKKEVYEDGSAWVGDRP